MMFGKSIAKGAHNASRAPQERDQPRGSSEVFRGHGMGAVLVFFVLALGLAFPASAAEDRCGSLFPDFTCDDHVSRPAGHVAPMSMPYLFEDPYITTELNLVGIYHEMPKDSILQGGEAGVIALQARLAITDRLAFIATKDGYTFMRNDNGLLNNEEGFMDITAGFKYAIIDDREAGLIVTPSLRYEVPLGSDGVFQGHGKGVIIPAVSVGYGPDAIHLIAGFGGQFAVDPDKNSSSLFYNVHLDQAFETDIIPGAKFIVPFIELNGMTYVDSGDGKSTLETDLGRLSLTTVQGAAAAGALGPIPADQRGEGGDIVNLGSKGMVGETLITMAWGVRIPFENGISTGLSYERAISNRKDIFEQRVTLRVSYDF